MSEDEANEMARRIDEVLHKNRDHLHLVAIPRTPLEDLLRAEDGYDAEEQEARNDERLQTLRALMEFFFQCGPEPLQLLRHVLAVTKAVRPDLLGDMSLEDISILCEDGGRATVSARIQRVYNGTLTKAGMRDVRAPFQKTGNFSAAQMGNQNRRKKKKHGGPSAETRAKRNQAVVASMKKRKK